MLYASGVTIPSDLSGALSGVGTPSYNTIGANYAAAKGKLARGATTMGMNGAAAAGPNSYAGNQLNMAQGRDVGNLESALGGGLGNTAYQNTLQQRDFTQNEDLARQVADLNKPDLLQQILSGVGNVGGTAARIYGAWGKNAPGFNPTGYGGGSGQLPPSLSLIPGGGYAQYMGGN